MRMVQAIIRPEKLDDVKKALEVKGFVLEYRGENVEVDTLPKIMLIMVVDNHDVNTIVSIIRASGRTGHIGDGKIFVLPVEMMARVRTDEEWR